MSDRLQLVRDCYTAWRTADRALMEQRLAADFTFSSPPDPDLDRSGYFARCWPGADQTGVEFAYTRLHELGDEVLVTYVATRPDGTRFQNTEIFGFDADSIARIEVYFGWDLR
jgi:ketosteroid isomerase-like protein